MGEANVRLGKPAEFFTNKSLEDLSKLIQREPLRTKELVTGYVNKALYYDRVYNVDLCRCPRGNVLCTKAQNGHKTYCQKCWAMTCGGRHGSKQR